VTTYPVLAALPLAVESCVLEALELEVAAGWTRRTTVVRLTGAGQQGLGEDVTYDGELQLARQTAGPLDGLAGARTLDGLAGARTLDGLAGARTLDSFSQLVGPLAEDEYQRWAYESAALDLALRQAGVSLGDLLGREPRPVRFVVSMGLGKPPSTARLNALLESRPGTRFKLDPTSAWDERLIRDIAELGAVDTLDFKGVFRGDFGEPPDPGLYRRVAEAFPEAWLEDPSLDDSAADAALAPFRDRITWDAPIHSTADIEALPFPPRTLNFKPSRFGTVRALFDAYDYCAERGIAIYGGGQSELGPGRGQIQQLASLFHPEAPNDVAPSGYNAPTPARDLPSSPLDPPRPQPGFGWRDT
jgi:L-alanine-DL-glutamate epimerase-like enolase superfamily enzyme